MNKLILPISEIVKMARADIPILIATGYLQSDCSMDGTVDYSDAIRIYLENQHPELCLESSELLGTLIHIYAEREWEAEFPNGRSVERV